MYKGVNFGFHISSCSAIELRQVRRLREQSRNPSSVFCPYRRSMLCRMRLISQIGRFSQIQA